MTTNDDGAKNQAPATSLSAGSTSEAFWNRYFAAPTVESSTRRTSGLPYIGALDGIRAIAVIAVLLYHANQAWLPGGFLGVDVFFVLSGYLITSILLAERGSTGSVDLKSFWIRRARRLLPAVYTLIIVCLAYAVIWLPGQVTQLRADAAAAGIYLTNWWLIFAHQSYFEAMGRPSLLRHLWSLAVEEQFYLIWPPLFVLGMTRLRRRSMLAIVLFGSLMSAALMAVLFQPALDPSRIYYGTDTRAAELLVGAALAFVWQPSNVSQWTGIVSTRIRDWFEGSRWSVVVLEGSAAIGLASVSAAFWRINEFSAFLYRGGFLLVALTTALLIAAVVHPRTNWSSRALGWAPLRWIGLRSYGIYLWHWPVYMVTRPGLDVPLRGVPLFLMRVAITLVLVELSYRFVEKPFRSGRVGRAWRAFRVGRKSWPRATAAGWLSASSVIAASAVALGVAVVRAQPTPPPPYLTVQEVHIVASPPTTVSPSPTPTPTPTPTPAPNVAAVTPAATLTPQPVNTSVETLATPMPDPATGVTPPDVPTLSISTPVPEPTPELPPPATPTVGATYASAPTVTAIGDSVMLGAATELVNDVPNLDLDAKVGLQVPQAIQILQQRDAAGRLRQVVVLDIGNNGLLTSSEFDQVMQIAGSKRRVIFVNLHVPRAWEGPNNSVIASGVARYPNATLLDWHADTADHPELFWGDGIHLRPAGANYYAMLVAQLVDGSS